MFNRFSKILTFNKVIQPIAKRELSHFFCASKSKIPSLLESFIGHDEGAKSHYFAYVDYFDKAKRTFENKSYSLAIKYLQQARSELAETTDLSNLTMSLFGQMEAFEKHIRDEMPPAAQKAILTGKK